MAKPLRRRRFQRRRTLVATIALAGAGVVIAAFTVSATRGTRDPDKVAAAWRARDGAIARARVAIASSPESRSNRSASLNAALAASSRDGVLECDYVPKDTTATTPKFDCRLSTGEVVKVKYDTLEIPAEVAGTRVLAGLGLAADEVSLVSRVRCRGCPPAPFQTRKFLERFHAGALADRYGRMSGPQEFSWVAIERKYPGRSFEFDDVSGWSYGELDRVRADRGGASRAEIDALRLMTVFLGHWDNKPKNQRLACAGEPASDESAKPCHDPVLVIHDLGSTFGGMRVDLKSWSAEPIWADEARCLVKIPVMAHTPGWFTFAQISEAGRLWLASRLQRLDAREIAEWFGAARFPDPEHSAVWNPDDERGDITAWVRAFQDKVRQIANRAPCPGT